ncbi:methylmalonic aciduria and homocystinuria type D protein [Chlorogloeopsis sp. ULAP01]|uniref:methylmalonic aciduria and homocystinuria type D protein n=1 Tax=Chlorogloeopsis sp. ULAP01 TaxID=3056483 RepID=UPI0025AA38AB|nr:methylmalonic aciduria and homocystinuria type D protein [Chlorogloeopsis sp. ULAP01]MDM9383158.1 methylmalonic aciduria and homocystinuria type D protein [Chlorogloeopsis sp. ULAP01]
MNHPVAHTSAVDYPIHLIGTTAQAVEISIHSPSQYICANCEKILPDWKNQLSFWVVIFLQQSKHEIVESSLEIEAEKQRLREKFMKFGLDVAFVLRDRGYLTDLIDPRTGYPLFSRPGKFPHDDTAAVKALLGYPVIKNKCRVLIHPHWGTAVYPSILLSAAYPFIIESVIKSMAPLHGWKEKSWKAFTEKSI